jgi:hypothetical protein
VDTLFYSFFADVDHCSDGTLSCGANSFCKNNDGSADACMCVTGYEDNSGNCVDTDECSEDTSPCDTNAACDNFDGSFR